MAESPEEADPRHDLIYGSDQEVIEEALRMLRELDSAPPHQMTPLFYQHGYEELRMMVDDLLRILRRGPAA